MLRLVAVMSILYVILLLAGILALGQTAPNSSKAQRYFNPLQPGVYGVTRQGEETFDIKQFLTNLADALDSNYTDQKRLEIFAEMLKRLNTNKSHGIYSYLRCVAELAVKPPNTTDDDHNIIEQVMKCLLNALG